MQIINYGHACFKIIEDGISVVLDPYEDNSVPGLELNKNIKANFVFASHSHADHNAIRKIEIEKKDFELKRSEILLPHDEVNGNKRGMSFARIFYFSTYSICHLGDIGDSQAVEKCLELKDIDIVLCPINGFFTISAETAIKLKKKMNWKLIIPMHYEIKERGSGYPDGGQIDIFKRLLPNHLIIDNDHIDINNHLFKYDSLIFNKNR